MAMVEIVNLVQRHGVGTLTNLAAVLVIYTLARLLKINAVASVVFAGMPLVCFWMLQNTGLGVRLMAMF
jgi:hypothetical protein